MINIEVDYAAIRSPAQLVSIVLESQGDVGSGSELMQPLDFSLKNVEVNRYTCALSAMLVAVFTTILQAEVMAVAFLWYFKAVRLVKTLVTLPRSVSAYLGSWLAVSVRFRYGENECSLFIPTFYSLFWSLALELHSGTLRLYCSIT